ncbi:MAG: DUF309 domain-containing protein [Pseudonocardiaceae bacterium]|nr:DUF309 domain-containing protein [Pseudonocardiaceae bacterium]
MATSKRDRDPQGRPRNARPRDSAGRPLPRGAEGLEQPPEDDAAPEPREALREAQQLLDTGYPFHAHEVLEAAWKASSAPERDMWQGLAQLAVGLTHAQRGNATGAAALLRRGAERIGTRATDPPHGLDLAGLVQHAVTLAERIERDGLDGLSADDLIVRLRGALAE